MSQLGIYFGPKFISVTEAKGKKLIKTFRIPQPTLSPGGFDQGMPDMVKTVTLLKEELRKNEIESSSAVVAFSGKDLIIRIFEMPNLVPDELKKAIDYEAKKYIPFKVDDLVSDSQAKFDRSLRKNLVLYSAIKKDTLDRYLGLLAQMNIKAERVEYCAFSALRFLLLGGGINSGLVAVISVDFQEEGEVDFMVLENGFPLFSRDIALIKPGESAAGEAQDLSVVFDKLKSELRASLDYCRRKFPGKKIQKVHILCAQQHAAELESFMSEAGLSAKVFNAEKMVPPEKSFSLSMIKSFGCSLYLSVKTVFKIDLLAASRKEKTEEIESTGSFLARFSAGLKINPYVIVLAILVFGGVLAWEQRRIKPIQKELEEVIKSRIMVASVGPDANIERIRQISTEYKSKIDTLKGLINGQVFATEILDSLPRTMPDGMWLTNLSFKNEGDVKSSLILEGICFVSDSDKEFQLVNQFFSNLNQNVIFKKYFKLIEIVSLERKPLGKVSAANFRISCSN